MNKSNCFCEKCKNCNKKYKCSSGLWYHKKTCKVLTLENTTIANKEISNEVITQFKDELKEQNQQHQNELKKQNQTIEELKNLIIEFNNRIN